MSDADEHAFIAQTKEDLEHERAKLLSQAHLQKGAMVRLLEDRNFQMYVLELQKQIDRRLVSLLQMPSGTDDVVKKTYNSGEMAGLKLALDLPSVLIEYAQSSIESARINEEISHGENTKTSNGDASSDAEPGFFDDDIDFDGRTVRRFQAP